jgi:branched-chain amino acid transport system substrate-binding protein
MKKSLLLAGLVLAAFAFSAPLLLAQEKVLKIGIFGPMTGGQALTGQEFKISTEMAMENVNYKIGDYKLEVVWIDSQCDPAKATAAYAEAIEKQGVHVGAMNFCSSVGVAVMDVLAEAKVPHLFGGAASELMNEKYRSDPKKYSYASIKGWPVPASLMRGYVEAIDEAIAKGAWKPEKKTIGIYGEDTDWGRSAGGALKRIFSEAGWEVVSEDYFLSTQTDFYSLLNRYRSNKVAVIAGTSMYPAMGALIKQSKEVGLKSLIIADGMGWVGNWFDLIGSAADGVLDMIPQLVTPAAKEWAKKFEARTGQKPSPSSGGLAYDGVNLLIKVLKRTLEKHGKLDSASINEVVVSELHTGKLTFTKEDGAILMNAYIYTPETVPDPVVGPEGYFFPVLQYDGKGAGQVVYPPFVAATGLRAP